MTTNTNPNFRTGQIPTAVQWNADFGEKVDASAGTSNNQVINTPTINGAVGGSPSFAQLNATVLAFSATTARTLSSWFSDVTNVKAFGATGNGVTDDTAAIQAAITAASTGRLFFPDGTYIFSSTLTRPISQTWIGTSPQSATLKWAGANSTDLITNSYDSTTLNRGGMRSLTIDAGTATGVTMLHIKNHRLGVFEDLLLQGNDGANNIGVVMEAGADSQSINCLENTLRYVYINKVTTGIKLKGTTSPGTAITTDNSFFHLTITLTSTAAGKGIVFSQWADTNHFFYTRVTAQAASSTLVIFNEDDPTGTPSVYNNCFFGFATDNIGSIAGSTAFKINSSYGLVIHGVFLSPSPYTDTAVDASSDARSYDILFVNPQTIAGISSMERVSHGIINGELSGPYRNLSASTYYRTPTSGALTSAALGAANRIYATPIFIGDTSTVKNLNFNVTSASGSDWNAAMGIYADNGFFSPGSLVANTDTGTIAVATGFTGTKSATLNGGSGVSLKRGIYWTVFVADATGASLSSASGSAGGTWLGGPFIGTGSLTNAFTVAMGAAKYVDHAFGALPASFGTPTISGTTAVPVVVYGA